MDMRDQARLTAARDELKEAARRYNTANAVVKKTRRERLIAIHRFREAGGSLTELSMFLGLSKSGAQAQAQLAQQMVADGD